MFRLLDTNIIGELVRNPRGPAAMILAERSDMDIATSVIVEGELRCGCRKKGSDRLTARVEALLAEVEILDIDSETAREYGRLRTFLEASGQMIGGNDLWIAGPSDQP